MNLHLMNGMGLVALLRVKPEHEGLGHDAAVMHYAVASSACTGITFCQAFIIRTGPLHSRLNMPSSLRLLLGNALQERTASVLSLVPDLLPSRQTVWAGSFPYGSLKNTRTGS